MPSYYPEGNVALASDNEMRSLQKVVDLLRTGGSGETQVYTGAAAPAAPDDPTVPALYYPTGGGPLQQWDVASQAWV